MEALNKFINEKLKLNKNTKLTNIKFVIWFKKFLYILLSELKDGHQYINNYTQIQHDAISLLEKINNNENYVISCFCKIESTNDFKNKISLPDLSYFDKSISKHIVEIYISILASTFFPLFFISTSLLHLTINIHTLLRRLLLHLWFNSFNCIFNSIFFH